MTIWAVYALGGLLVAPAVIGLPYKIIKWIIAGEWSDHSDVRYW